MKKRNAIAAVIGVLLAAGWAEAQVYPATLRVPVTFYDYHSNGSNPDFNPAHQGNWYVDGRHLNMVASDLDANGLPVLGTSCNLNWGINKWFVPWQTGDHRMPVYYRAADAPNPIGALKSLTADAGLAGDTAYKNFVIQDTLIFASLGGGMYGYNNQAFFVLDNMGFGKEPTWRYDYNGNDANANITKANNPGGAGWVQDHNYSFTMRMHWQFTYVPGQTFTFTGDDDVWVFINHKLALDIGGIHQAITDNFTLDAAKAATLGSLVAGKQYDFDMFYCERQSTESHIQITSNIISAPAKISLTRKPAGDTIAAGDSVQMFANVVDDAGISRPDFSDSIKWQIININPPITGVPVSHLREPYPLKDSNNVFYGIEAYHWYTIQVWFNSDPLNPGRILVDTVRIYVKPALPSHLDIEASPLLAVSPNADAPLLSVTLTSTMLKDSVYAILRDRFGNFYKDADSAAWNARDAAVVSVQPGNTALGQGVITRLVQSGNTMVYAAQDGMKDSLPVILNNVSYSKIIIAARQALTVDMVSLSMRTDQDTTLWAKALRADGSGIWDAVQVKWSNSTNLTFDNPAPSGISWTFRPTTAASGKIYINYQGLADSITATFSPGLPNRMALYPAAGTPNIAGNMAYLPAVPVTAGQALPLYAKIFSTNNEWLSSYEGANAPMTWTVTDPLGNPTTAGTLNTYTGSMAAFTGTKAYQSVKVTATFTGGITQSIVITIQPAAASQLVIEPDATGKTAYPNVAHRAGTVTIGGTSTVISVYAVLRDQFGNFVSFSDPTTWTSRNSAVVGDSVGNASVGEGICIRIAASGQAYVLAQDVGNPALHDSVQVVLSNISYTALRIVVRDSAAFYNHNLVMSIDQDTILKVQGLKSDGTGWVDVPAAWAITGTFVNPPAPPGADSIWLVVPSDTGTGWIKVTMGSALPDSVKVTFLHGAAKYISLYPLEGPPGLGNANYPDPLYPIADTAGVGIQVVAKVFDKAGIWLSNLEIGTSPVTWKSLEFAANKQTPTGSLSLGAGDKTVFTPATAYNSVYVVATYSDGSIVSKDSIQLHILPGPVTHLVIEAAWDSTVSLNADKRLGSMRLGSATLKDSAFAVLRDAFGNFVGRAIAASWTSRNSAVVTAALVNPSRGEGEVTRQTPNSNSAVVAVTQNGLKDSVLVNLDAVSYTQIQIVVRGSVNIDTLQMRTDQDTTLMARGLRADNGQWQDIPVTWGASTGLSFETPAPSGVSSWTFSPAGTGSGKIFILWTNGVQLRTDTITAIFSYGNPASMALYPAAGAPSSANKVYPDSVTVVAGVPFPITAKLFTQSNDWLSGYERSNAPFAWNIDPANGGAATLDKYSGFQVAFTGIKAYQTVKVTATFTEGTVVLAKSLFITITPGAAAMLDIEADATGKTSSPNAPNRAGSVSIMGSDTTISAYAVLRDQFGNFVGFSNPTSWLSRDTAQAAVRNGVPAEGEGIMIRVHGVGTGQAWVIAKDGKTPALTDSVLVVLSNVTYTALRIVAQGDTTKISSLTLEIEQDTVLQVQGLRSDGGGWDNVPAAWSITGGLTTTTTAPGASITWSVSATDTGSGVIRVKLGIATPDSVQVHFVHGVPRYIMLYPAAGDPSAQQPYPGVSQALVDSAGKALPVFAKVFDKANNWLSSYEQANAPITWSIVELQGNTDVPTGTFTPATGYKTSLTPTRANNTILLVAAFQENGQTYLDSIKVIVVAGKPDHLVIENDPNMQTSPHKDSPDSLVQIPSSVKYGVVYAVIRDAYQNFIQTSQNTQWQSLDTAVVTAADGQKSLGQGVITRAESAPRDRAKVVASSLDYPALKDTTTALVLQYYYLALRIVVGANGTHIASLAMNTNQDTTLKVQGQRSTDSVWEYVPAAWESSSGLSIVPGAPANAQSWTFSPDKPGTGIIRVTLGNDTISTKPDFVTVNFTAGPPVSMEVQILTPPEQRIAGDTMIAVVRIKNADGLVPGQWCDTVTYQNALGTGGGSRPSPVVIGDTTVTMGTALKESFENGLDTVKYVLYYAPADKDSMEKVVAAMRGLSASTDPFTMYPGALSSIALQDFNGKNLDSIHLDYPNGSKLIISMGYDKYGNQIGEVNSNWTAGGTLLPIDKGTNVPRVYYDASRAKYDENGWITALDTTPGGAKITDSVRVSITGPSARLISSVTRDVNGDGYLDHIVLHFDKNVTWPDSGAYSITFSGTYQDPVTGEKVTYSLTVDSVSSTNGTRTDSVFVLDLEEPKSSDPMSKYPQTGWTPSITISGLSGVSPVVNTQVSDGAGPVVWMVTKTVGSASSRTDDKVTVTFSEPIGTNGNDFNSLLAPGKLIRVWQKVTTAAGTDTFIEVDTMLAGIKDFFQVDSNLSVEFYMTNGNDLTTRDYVSLYSDSTGRSLSDRSGTANTPAANNRRVQVVERTAPVKQMLVAPNPSSPTFNRERPGELHLAFQPSARAWVRQDGAGSILTFKIVPVPGQIVTGRLFIFDAVGNAVASVDSSKSTAGIIPQAWVSSNTISTTYDYDIYWNGSNARGLKCSTGVYRTMLVLWYSYTDGSGRKTVSKLQGTVGIILR